MKQPFIKMISALIIMIILPAGAYSQVSAENREPLTEEHLRLILGDSTSLTDLSLPDGQVITERWYKGTEPGEFTGFFHIKTVASPENGDELITQHDWVIRYRGKIMQGRLRTISKRDKYYTMQSFKLVGKYGEGKGRDYIKISAEIEPSPPGDSLPYIIKTPTYFRNLPKGCPDSMMMTFLVCEKIRELPFDRDEVFTFNYFFPFEMEIVRDLSLRYVGAEDTVPDEVYGCLHRFVCEGVGHHTMYLLVDDNHELIEITNNADFEIKLTTKREVIDNWDF